MSVQVNAGKQFLVIFFLIVILLTVIEISVRIVEWIYPNCSFMDSDAMKDRSLFEQRQICYDQKNLKFHEEPMNRYYPPDQSSTTLNINSWGFRGQNIELEKSNDEFRIFVIGGSTVFGTGVFDDETIPALIEKNFLEFDLNKDIVVVNAGVSGTNSFDEVKYIKEKIFTFEPDFLIIYDGWNDAWHREIIFDTYLSENNKKIESYVPENDKKIELKNQGTGIISFFQNNIKFYHTPLYIYQTFFYDKDWRYEKPPKDYGEIESLTQKSWSSNWTRFCTSFNEIPTVVFLQPVLGTGEKIFSNGEKEILPKSQDDIDTVRIINGMKNSIPEIGESCTNAFDLTGIFDDTAKPIFYDKGHVNKFGNEIIANEIYQKILPIIKKYL
tara:strand:- start:2403 stop:3554 length:1152 start_codon:yes stop_codon:yes gene_type:complete